MFAPQILELFSWLYVALVNAMFPSLNVSRFSFSKSIGRIHREYRWIHDTWNSNSIAPEKKNDTNWRNLPAFSCNDLPTVRFHHQKNERAVMLTECLTSLPSTETCWDHLCEGRWSLILASFWKNYAMNVNVLPLSMWVFLGLRFPHTLQNHAGLVG